MLVELDIKRQSSSSVGFVGIHYEDISIKIVAKTPRRTSHAEGCSQLALLRRVLLSLERVSNNLRCDLVEKPLVSMIALIFSPFPPFLLSPAPPFPLALFPPSPVLVVVSTSQLFSSNQGIYPMLNIYRKTQTDTAIDYIISPNQTI